MKTFAQHYHAALNVWLNKPQTKGRLDGIDIGVPKRHNEFLVNRITLTYQEAFTAGFEAGKQAAMDQILEVIK